MHLRRLAAGDSRKAQSQKPEAKNFWLLASALLAFGFRLLA
jgi:hypothetical protein